MHEPIFSDIDEHELVFCSEEEKFLSRGIHTCMSQELDADSLLTLGQELLVHEDAAWPL